LSIGRRSADNSRAGSCSPLRYLPHSVTLLCARRHGSGCCGRSGKPFERNQAGLEWAMGGAMIAADLHYDRHSENGERAGPDDPGCSISRHWLASGLSCMVPRLPPAGPDRRQYNILNPRVASLIASYAINGADAGMPAGTRPAPPREMNAASAFTVGGSS
jgi:hypothetical protein